MILLTVTALLAGGLVLHTAARWCGDADCAFKEYERLLREYRVHADEVARRRADRQADLGPLPTKPVEADADPQKPGAAKSRAQSGAAGLARP